VTGVVDAFSDGARARLDVILQHVGRILEIAVDGDLPDGGPHFWTMWRRPHPIRP
jgi:hypothetical protein